MYDPALVPLSCRIPEAVKRALDERRRTSGETVDAIVAKALVEHLQAGWSTLFQVSTAGALVEGVHEGAVSVHFLKEHGDLGLGTFTNLDGEMVVVDGRCYQVRSDGSVREVDDAERSPYAVLTQFQPDSPVAAGGVRGGRRLAQAAGRAADDRQPVLRLPDRRPVRVRPRPGRAEGRRGDPAARGGGQAAGIRLPQRPRHACRLLVARLRQDPHGPRLPLPLPDRRPQGGRPPARLPDRRPAH